MSDTKILNALASKDGQHEIAEAIRDIGSFGNVVRAEEAANEAKDHASLSKDWAIKTDAMVEDEDYSSKYYALKAHEDRNDTADFKDQAEVAKDSALQSATAATQAKDIAVSAKDDAQNYAEQAQNALTDINTGLASKADKSNTYTKTETDDQINTKLAELVSSAPATLDTLEELASALGDDPNFATTVATQIGTKAPLASPAFTGTPTAPTPANGDNSTKIATTEFVNNEQKENVPLSSMTFVTELTNEHDLDNIISVGTYIWNSNVYYPANIPTGVYYARMFVFKIQGNGYVAQLIYPHEQGKGIWYRVKSGGSGNWSNWKHFAFSEEVLPLSGGTMTGTITSSTNTTLKRDVDNANNIICGGTSTSNGGYAVFYGKDHSSSAGKFLLSTSNNYYFIGSPDGTLRWGSKEVERVYASGTNYIRYESGLQICWGTGSTSGGIHQYTFPVAFSATPNVSLTPTSAENSTPYFCKIADLSTTGVKALTMNSNGYIQLRTYYIAVGFWK